LSRWVSVRAGPSSNRATARARKHRGIGHRLRREEPFAEILFEGRAEALAERPLDEAHRPPAARAEGSMRIGCGAAGQTGRRVERIERRAGETPGEGGRPAGPERPGGVVERCGIRNHERS
jgi:hypothetical protein